MLPFGIIASLRVYPPCVGARKSYVDETPHQASTTPDPFVGVFACFSDSLRVRAKVMCVHLREVAISSEWAAPRSLRIEQACLSSLVF